MEADMICRLRPKYPIVDLGALTGHDFYHLEHYHPRTALFARPHVVKNAPVNLQAPAPALHPNSTAWGLDEHALAVEPGRVASESAMDEPDHRNDEVSAFARLMSKLVMDTVADRIAVYGTVQSRLWGRRWRRLRTAVAPPVAERP
jgi:hypothetical protein